MKKDFGFIIINKPVGPTSHGIINKLRKITGIKKIGHAGTLDPFASGVLICAIGRQATKQIDGFVKLKKEYVADLQLGAETDTYDREGVITKKVEPDFIPPQDDIVAGILKTFQGPQKQVPPMFSAKKIQGKKLYQLARKGVEIERQPSDIEIFYIQMLNYEWPRLKIKVGCSSGTYIRSLAFDIGRELGCSAYLQELQRTAVGNFNLEQAVEVEKLNENNWVDFLFNN